MQKEIRKKENIKEKYICLQSRKIKGNISERRVKNIFNSHIYVNAAEWGAVMKFCMFYAMCFSVPIFSKLQK